MKKQEVSQIQKDGNSSLQATIYIAGKMEKSLRRYDLVDCTLTHSEKRRPKIAPLRKFTFNRQNYLYSGPFIKACHHMCEKDVCRKDKIYLPDMKIEHSESVFLRSLQGIQKADYIIAWLEDNDSYGTITELGYAFGLKKTIFIAYSPKITPPQDYWFVFGTAKDHRLCENREKGLTWLFAQITKDLKNKEQKNQEKPAQNLLNWPNSVQDICFGCVGSDSCLMKKKNILHCWKCGNKGYHTKNCTICPQKKVKIE